MGGGDVLESLGAVQGEALKSALCRDMQKELESWVQTQIPLTPPSPPIF